LIAGLASRLSAIPITVVMAVAYLTADFEAVTGIFSDPDKFVKADPFPYFISALIVLVFGPGKFSIDALIKWRWMHYDEVYASEANTSALL
jgi:putative oxidoreductase